MTLFPSGVSQRSRRERMSSAEIDRSRTRMVRYPLKRDPRGATAVSTSSRVTRVRVACQATPPPWTAALANLPFRDLVHAGRFERRARRQVLQPRDLIAQFLVLDLQGGPGRLGCRELIAQVGHLVLERLKPLQQITHEPTQTAGAQRPKGIIR